MSGQLASARPVPTFARAIGALCGLATAGLATAMLGAGIVPLLKDRGDRTLSEGIGFLGVLAFLPVIGLVLGIGIHAIVDALRSATGAPALRLGFFFLLLTIPLGLMTFESEGPARSGGWLWLGCAGGLAAGHLAAVRWFRAARRRPT